MIFDAYYWFRTSARDDVRWEKVEQIKRTLMSGTYAVPAIQVAAKVFRDTLELDRAERCWVQSGSSNKAKVNGENRA